jgi:hypothetical protein
MHSGFVGPYLFLRGIDVGICLCGRIIFPSRLMFSYKHPAKFILGPSSRSANCLVSISYTESITLLFIAYNCYRCNAMNSILYSK